MPPSSLKNLIIPVFGACPLLLFAELPQTPDQIYGQLFRDVQTKEVFMDQKTFVDAIPKRNPAAICSDYNLRVKDPQFNLKEFVAQNFVIPPAGEDILTHIKHLWILLERDPSPPPAGSSLLPLPYPYIIPGGRFREIYYWDSYFTMLGLRESGKVDMIENMVKNFASLIDRYGLIPNGNRSYYLSRSQPPYFSLMIELLAEIKGKKVYNEFLPPLLKEYQYWMDETFDTKHVVVMPDGSKLNRYYDRLDIPRQEAYWNDLETSRKSQQDKKLIFRNLRSAVESGWDFSSRWCADGQSLSTARAIDLVPVDLNSVLYNLEIALARAYQLRNDASRAKDFENKAEQRKTSINRYCWSPSAQWYVDCDLQGKPSPELTLAGMVPLFFQIAPKDRALAATQVLKKKFVQPGGVVTTLKNTGQQWDAPNGWAPLQWLTIQGLRNYGQDTLAKDIAERWMALNINVFKQTGKLMEKYNVMDLTQAGGGGEYPGQDGFGWTNGIFLKLVSLYGLPK